MRICLLFKYVVKVDVRLIVWIGPLLAEEIKRLVKSTEIIKEDDEKWPKRNVSGRQELEIRIDNEHINFEVREPM